MVVRVGISTKSIFILLDSQHKTKQLTSFKAIMLTIRMMCGDDKQSDVNFFTPSCCCGLFYWFVVTLLPHFLSQRNSCSILRKLYFLLFDSFNVFVSSSFFYFSICFRLAIFRFLSLILSIYWLRFNSSN